MTAKSISGPHGIARYIFMGAALYAFIQTFPLLSPILLSFLLIGLISLAANPLIARMRGLTGGRKPATGLMVAAVVLLLALAGMAFFGPMKASVAKLTEQIPSYWARLQKPLIQWEQRAARSEQKLQAEVATEMAEDADEEPPASAQTPSTLPLPRPAKEEGTIRASLSQTLKNVAERFASMAVDAAQILVVLVTVFVGVTFTLMNPRPILGAIFALVPEEHHNKTLVILRRIGQFVPQWALATLLGMATIGVLVFLCMWPIFGFMDALVLGLVAGLLEAIPFIGPTLSAMPAILFALGKGGHTPLVVLLLYVAVQALEGHVISPLIMARGMKMHPLAVLFSMLLCVAAFGVLGVVVAAPLAATVKILHDELYRKRALPSVTDADLDRLARQALRETKTSAP